MMVSSHTETDSPSEAIVRTPVLSHKRPLATSETPNEAENRRKDPKVSRACDSCKRKKIRCNGTRPCQTCAKRKIDCAYDAKYGRGRPPTPPFSTPSQAPVIDVPRPSIVPNGANELNTRSISISREPSQFLPNDTSPQALQEADIDDQYFDPTSGLNFLHRAWKKLSTQKGDDTSYSSNETERCQLVTSAGDRPFHKYGDLFDISESRFVPEDSEARNLLGCYFENCVVTYRMLHRPTIEAWMDVFVKDRRENRSITHSLGHAKSSILLAIMAIATLRNEKIHGSRSSQAEADALHQSDRLFCMSTSLTDAETGFPRLESAQARLLQVLYLLQTSRMNKGWYTFGNSCHMILSLGMHRRRDHQRDVPLMSRRLGYISLQCYKRTFWVAYTIDKYLSVVFGRPRHYQDEDIDQDFPDRVNDEDMAPQGPSVCEDSEDCHIDSVISHAKIARIIGSISRQVYCVGEMAKHDRLNAAQSFIQEIHQWRAALPTYLGSVKPSTLVPVFRRQAVALQLAYSHAIIHATRPFLLGDLNSEITLECISAARASLELVDKMAGDKSLFHAFWWTHYVTFCALAVVYVWGIQLVRRPGSCTDSEFYTRLFDLAEKCRTHLRQATAGLSPNRRYDIILEELRKEARNSHDNRGESCGTSREFWQSLGNGDSSSADDTLLHDSHIASSEDANFNYEVAQAGLVGSTFGFEGAFQFSDWLTLDSSAFLPVSDPNSVSPPWLSALP
ncbi:hypothetical protein PENSTE_c001G08590 [Penicillium steckii]|uniref:Zn(2)-C6 fungal-type domain-containing protein n=1 Tax=Penicillium steckii TaxID=303698 RepID=A0A1V6U1V5_9EURO|nr:hypothetical protein PENSTE_c001G08590 [Penicillium steckii]